MGVRHQPREMMKAPGSEDRGSLCSSVWWAMPGLNRRPLPCQGSALPLRQPPEVETGFEPVYTDLQSVASPLGHSTWMELLAPQAGWESLVLRADDEIRTRDPHLGKVMLYQLSHVRTLPPRPGYPFLGDALKTIAQEFGPRKIPSGLVRA